MKRFFKFLAVTILAFFIGLIFYLIVPIPTSSKESITENFPKDKTVEFVATQQNKGKKCDANTFYIKKEYIGYSDSEVIDEHCANLQNEMVDAAFEGNLDKIRSLLAQGANANSRAFPSRGNGDAYSPVIIAAMQKQTQAVKLLLDNSANANDHFTCCMSSQSLLMIAVGGNDLATTKLLLSRGANINFKSEFGDNDVFTEATRTGNQEIFNLLDSACAKSVMCRAESRALRLFSAIHKLIK